MRACLDSNVYKNGKEVISPSWDMIGWYRDVQKQIVDNPATIQNTEKLLAWAFESVDFLQFFLCNLKKVQVIKPF